MTMEYKQCILVGSPSPSVELLVKSLNLMPFEEDKNEVYCSIQPLSLQASNFRSYKQSTCLLPLLTPLFHFNVCDNNYFSFPGPRSPLLAVLDPGEGTGGPRPPLIFRPN